MSPGHTTCCLTRECNGRRALRWPVPLIRKSVSQTVEALQLFKLRPAGEADLPFLLDLRIQTIGQHFIAAGMPKSRDEHMQRVLYRFECAEVILVDEQPSGLLKLDRSGDEWHLMQMQLLPSLQRRGLGTRLLAEMITDARRAGASIRLGVLKVNPARRLYERLGFFVTSQTPDSLKMRLPQDLDQSSSR